MGGALQVGPASGDGQLYIYGAGPGDGPLGSSASVTNTNAAIGHIFGRYGYAVVSGEGALWQNNGTLTINNGQFIIDSGGTLNSNGAVLDSTFSGSYSAYGQQTGAGMVWNNIGSLQQRGGGELNIFNGATLNSGDATIGSVGALGRGIVYNGGVGNMGAFKFIMNGEWGVYAEGKIAASSVVLGVNGSTGGGAFLTVGGDPWGGGSGPGVLETAHIAEAAGSSGNALYLSGGTLRATQDENDCIRGFTSPGSVSLGSVSIDTNGHAIAINGSVLDDGGSGSGTVRKIGAGTLVEEGTLLVSNTTGSATGSGNIMVYDGATLAGSGSVTGNVFFEEGSIVAPGDSPGMRATGSQVWSGGGFYEWEINDATGLAGVNSDLIDLAGFLDVSALSPACPFTIGVISLETGNTPGLLAGFDASQDYVWLLAEAAGGITGFDPANFVVNVSAFQNPLLGGTFDVFQDGNLLNLRFTSAVPEPTSAAFLALGLAAAQRDGG